MSNTTQQIRAYLQEELNKVIFGTEAHLDIIAITLISGGNLLLAGAPGTGKNLLSKSLLRILNQETARIDCGNDIEYTNILHTLTRAGATKTAQLTTTLCYLAGINRLTPNTQAILLPMMEEHQLLNNGEIIKLGPDFRVIATYDPGCFDDTYPVIDALLDRFYVALSLRYPDSQYERDMLKAYDYPLARHEAEIIPTITPLPAEKIKRARDEARAVTVTDSIYDYVIQLMQSLRHHADIRAGASQRGTLCIMNAAKTHAAMMDRDYVNPDDIQSVIKYCLGHRLRLNSDALINGTQTTDIIDAIVQQTELPNHASDQN